jgi:hypothetical protein
MNYSVQKMPDSELIRMALGAKAKVSSNPEKWDVLEFDPASLERFANFVAADAYEKGWNDAMFRKSLEEK